ncbi:class E sortase [Streptomyces sp. NPDC046985]|uniref:class E sortase n=1 Tax=Streptomyces sp. NPDC046985 TaxID=3155377 RepID=UPI0033E372F7
MRRPGRRGEVCGARPGGGQGHGVTALRPGRDPGADGRRPQAQGAPEDAYAPAPEDAYAPASGDAYAAAPADAYAAAPYDAREGARYAPLGDDATMALRLPAPRPSSAAPGASSGTATTGDAPEGRAARRKAARGRHGRHGGARPAPGTEQDARETRDARDSRDAGEAPSAPLSRMEARRLARARRPGPLVIASRTVGELFITTGLVMLLFVTYQLWWTNVRAHQQAGSEAHQLQDDWASGKRSPGVFEPGQGFAILHIPKLDVVAPIAEGTSKSAVLDKGMVGHYGRGDLNTAMPDAKTGNFGLAGHRNTHGEPFRYINRLTPGDPIVVETQDTYYVYKTTSTLPVTSPANTAVLDPVPKGSGFTAPGRYITLTTCTPEFTSRYRLIVWGRMVEERPRSKGKPDALVS